MSTSSEGIGQLSGQRVLVTGAGGQLGRLLVPAVRRFGAAVIAFGSRPDAGIDVAVDLAERDDAIPALRAARPDVVIQEMAEYKLADPIPEDPEDSVR